MALVSKNYYEKQDTIMYARVLNLYSNEALNDQGLIKGHGQSFLIAIGEELILYDTGSCSKNLLSNMETLSISPDMITKLVLSHGHLDHTGGLPGFLDKRDSNSILPLMAHPDCTEKKIYKIMKLFRKNLSCPKLTDNQNSKLNIQLSREPQQITSKLKTTGEITYRNELHRLESNAICLKKDKYVVDPVTDDLSLILSSKKGEVIITGCAHSGILNICNHVKKTSNKKIHAIVGGTHMVRYSEDDVKYVANRLAEDFDNPDLYLNHCTDHIPDPFIKKTKATVILKKQLGPGKLKDCFVGTKIEFEI